MFPHGVYRPYMSLFGNGIASEESGVHRYLTVYDAQIEELPKTDERTA